MDFLFSFDKFPLYCCPFIHMHCLYFRIFATKCEHFEQKKNCLLCGIAVYALQIEHF